MKLAKKVLSGISLGSMILAVVMLLVALFGGSEFVFSGVGLDLLLSFAIIAVASAFAINACNVYSRKKIISIINLSLLGLCVLLGLLSVWIGDFPLLLANITYVLAIATVFFGIIVSLNLKLGKRQRVLQGITYVCVIVIDIILTLLIFGVDVFAVDGLSTMFIALCLVAFALLCATAILGKKSITEDVNSSDMITISKIEYENLKAKVFELQQEIKELKNQNQEDKN